MIPETAGEVCRRLVEDEVTTAGIPLEVTAVMVCTAEGLWMTVTGIGTAAGCGVLE